MSKAISQTTKQTKPLSNYRLLALVGQGQFAQVYCAIHRRTGQLAAIKQARHAPEHASQEPFILTELDHPNLVRCEAIVQTEEGYQFVLEYCESGTLRSHLSTAAPLPFAQTKSLISQILQGLNNLHRQGIIHNDLKPENILLTHSNLSPNPLKAKIGDFGSARFIQFPNRSRREIGSPTYAAPERFNGQSSPASDLYALGVILYEMLLGDRPFSGTPSTLLQAHQHNPIPLPGTLSPAARQFFATALHKQPERRFPSASAMLGALHHLHPVQQTTEPVPAVSISQTLTPLQSTDIHSPVEALLNVPQGCYITTQNSLHFLNRQQQLSAVAQFKKNVWTAIDPKGKWLITMHHQPGQTWFHSFNKVGQIYNSKPIALSTSLHTALRSKVVQLLAVSFRYLLKIRASHNQSKTYLEFFTRKGRLIGELTVNLAIARAVLTATPYQLIARTAASHSTESEVVLITLKPFQIKRLGAQQPQRVSALSWGNLVGFPQHSLLLDHSANPVSILNGLPSHSAIASLGDRNLLIATPSNPPALLTADLKEIDLGLIF